MSSFQNSIGIHSFIKKNKESFILENYFLFNKISVDDINSYNILEKYILTYNEHNNNIPILTNLHKINKGDITYYNKSLVRLKQVMTPIYITHHELTNRNELYDQFHITINNYHNRYSYDKINRFLQSNFNMNIESFTKYILSNSSKYIKEMNKDVYFTFPKGTHFIMGTSFKDTKDINFDFSAQYLALIVALPSNVFSFSIGSIRLKSFGL